MRVLYLFDHLQVCKLTSLPEVTFTCSTTTLASCLSSLKVYFFFFFIKRLIVTYLRTNLNTEFGALIVFAEHRYYGQSMPFGNQSMSNSNLQYCTAEQALADFAALITYLKSVPSPRRRRHCL